MKDFFCILYGKSIARVRPIAGFAFIGNDNGMLVLDILHKDRILEGLPLLEHQLLTPLCEDIALHLGDIIEEAGHSVQFLYFPIDSAISMTHVQDQEHMVEVMVTGKEGCTGASIVLGDDRSPSMAMIQIGGVAIRIATSDVITRLSRLPYLKACLTRYNLLTMNLAVLSVGCSQFHAPPQRVARWLIAHWYRTGIESFPFSCEFLAVQVGVHPTIVKETLVDFER